MLSFNVEEIVAGNGCDSEDRGCIEIVDADAAANVFVANGAVDAAVE